MQELCRYERDGHEIRKSTAADVTSPSSGESSNQSSTTSSDPQLLSTTQLSPHDHKRLVSILGYSTHNVHNTFSLVNKVVTTHSSISSALGPAEVCNRKQSALEDKYRSLVRQLPSMEHIDTFIQQYFSEINWQYDVLDEITFHQQFASWRHFPYSAHSHAIDSLPADILAFPSLLFQLMAHCLIHQPVGERASPSVESLKYASGMTFVDLACESSEAGYSMIEAMGKDKMSVVAVQSGLLRASFLKNTGSVIEAWHVVGTTIRNAQEIGLHATVAAQDPLGSIDARWDHEMRCRVWFVLHNWDIHMAMVLGRPMATATAVEKVLPPDDLAQRESGKPPRKRTSQDAPTPSSVIRIGYDIAYQYFPRVREFENRGARTEDYQAVRETHAAIVRSMDLMPRWLRHDDPDIHFDGLPNCQWLPAARLSLTSSMHFVLLSLHRPYIFSVPESRTEALKAGLSVFIAQRRLFQLSTPKQYLAFNMVYPLFDAMVISLAILVLFPNENSDIHSRSVENVYWGNDILAAIGHHNAMARSANGVVKSLISRLEEGPRYSIQHFNHKGRGAATESLGSTTADPPALENSSSTTFMSDDSGPSNLVEPSSTFHHQARSTASNASAFDVESLLPPRPVSDLYHQDIYSLLPQAIQGADFPGDSLHFDDIYADDSFWSFMNDLIQGDTASSATSV